MLSGGPILKYLTRMADDDKNKLILVGYQAEGTRGKMLAEGAKKLEIDGKQVDINLKVEQYRLSAHADRQQLHQLIGKVQDLEDLFIVHGEPSKSKELAAAQGNRYKVHIPELRNSFGV
jgi:predicted metal-dependent RNase